MTGGALPALALATALTVGQVLGVIRERAAVDMWSVIAAAFPAAPGYAYRVALCESGLDVHARSAGWDRTYGWYDYRGVFQVSADLHSGRAERLYREGRVATADLYDPVTNVAVAAEILREQGWGAWPYCSRHA